MFYSMYLMGQLFTSVVCAYMTKT